MEAHKEQYNLLHVTYGSKLYGTSTPTSDTDDKVVYVPALADLLLGKKVPIYKVRVDADGAPLPDKVQVVGEDGTVTSKNLPMPANGVETEYFPVQTFVRDFVNGQTYALEMAHAYLSGGEPKKSFGYTCEISTYNFMKEMVDKFTNADVYSMVGFAMKQTFDYVHRGERMNAAKAVLEVVDRYMDPTRVVRLDTFFNGVPLLELLAAQAGLETEVLTNGKKPMNSLKLNGRNYMETTTLEHLRAQLVKVVEKFGERSSAAADADVDHKSLSHAVRVYQQAIELLETGTMTFPRPNADYLLKVKQGQLPLEDVRLHLSMLEEEVQQMLQSTTLQKKTPELVAESEEWMLKKLLGLYGLYED